MYTRHLCTLAVATLLTVSLPATVSAQVYFKDCLTRTGNNAHLLIPSGVPTDGDVSIDPGDELAAITPDGKCVGSVVWKNGPMALTIWGDDSYSPQKDSYADGDSIRLVFWDSVEKSEFEAIELHLSDGSPYYRADRSYERDAIYLLESLSIREAAAELAVLAPRDDARAVPVSPTLRWQAVIGATSYDVQVAPTESFVDLVVDKAALTTTELVVDGLQEGTVYHWRVRANRPEGATDFKTASFKTVSTQMIELDAGWNLVSGRVAPVDDEISDIFGAMSTDVLLVKNAAGQMFYPEFGINTIGEWDVHSGYYVYSRKALNLEMTGDRPELDSTITLQSGWNIVAYWPDSPLPVQTAMGTVADRLVLVKNGQGQIWLPEFNVNTIGTLTPGAGYQVYVTRKSELRYPAAAAKTGTSNGVASGHSAVVNNATLIIEVPGAPDGTVVQARVGSAVIGEGSAHDGQVVLILEGDDDFTKEVREGALQGDRVTLDVPSGEPFTLRAELFRSLLTGEQWTELTYRQDEVWIAEAVISRTEEEQPSVFQLDQNYPNPFNPSTSITFSLEKAGAVRLEVFNVLGQRVDIVLDEERTAGRHTVMFDARDLTSGVYVYRLVSDGHVAVRQMLLLK